MWRFSWPVSRQGNSGVVQDLPPANDRIKQDKERHMALLVLFYTVIRRRKVLHHSTVALSRYRSREPPHSRRSIHCLKICVQETRLIRENGMFCSVTEIKKEWKNRISGIRWSWVCTAQMILHFYTKHKAPSGRMVLYVLYKSAKSSVQYIPKTIEYRIFCFSTLS